MLERDVRRRRFVRNACMKRTVRLCLAFAKKVRAKLDESFRCVGRRESVQKGTARVAEACEFHKGAYVMPSVVRLGELD